MELRINRVRIKRSRPVLHKFINYRTFIILSVSTYLHIIYTCEMLHVLTVSSFLSRITDICILWKIHFSYNNLISNCIDIIFINIDLKVQCNVHFLPFGPSSIQKTLTKGVMLTVTVEANTNVSYERTFTGWNPHLHHSGEISFFFLLNYFPLIS